MFDRVVVGGLTVALGLVAMATALSGCGAIQLPSRVDCNVVRLQTQAGRSDSEIASALGVTAQEVEGCHAIAAARGSKAGTEPVDSSAYISAGQATGALTSEPEKKPEEEEKPPWMY